MPRTMADLAVSASRMPDAIQRGQLAGVKASALVITREIRRRTRIATGGDMRMSGVGKKGARVGARYDVRGKANPTAVVRATGPYHLLERDTKAHAIGPRKRRGTKALKLATGVFRSRVKHPGTQGKHVFETSVLAKRDEAGRAFNEKVEKSIQKEWLR